MIIAKRDEQLQLVRRIDWRFLLPEPQLKTVLVIGKPDEPLLTSLNFFAENVVEIDQVQQLSNKKAHLLVAANASVKHIQSALPYLKSDASIYWEIYRSKLSKRITKGFSQWQKPEKYATDLVKIGFSDIGLHWHRPGFIGCKEMIPLDKENALSFAMDKGYDNFKGATKQLSGNVLQKTGALAFYIRAFSLVGRRS